MARLDGEEQAVSQLDREHLSTCPSCQQWLADFRSLAARLEGLGYPGAPTDLWTGVESRIAQADPIPSAPHRLWLIGGIVLGMRTLQLLIDFPVPILQLFVPIVAAAVIAAVWKIAGGALSIETWAPELRKGDM
jgi:hypothetical protein